MCFFFCLKLICFYELLCEDLMDFMILCCCFMLLILGMI